MRAARAGKGRTTRCGLTGSLESFPLAELVQTLNLSRKTARVDIDSRAGESALWFAEGALVHAAARDATGEDALFEALRWREGRFRVEDGADAPRRTITGDTMFLLFEGLRRLDESGLDPETGTPVPAEEPAAPALPTGTRWERPVAIAIVGAMLCVGVAWATRDLEFGARASDEAADAAALAALRAARPELLEPAVPGADVDLESAPAPVERAPVRRSAPAHLRKVAAADPGPVLVGPDPRVAADPGPVLASLLPGPYVGPILAPATAPVERGALVLEIVSRVPEGLLSIEIDGREALRREVRWEASAAKRFFKRVAGTDGDRFEHRFELDAGDHVVVARLANDTEGTSHEVRLDVAVERDAETTRRLVAARRDGGTLSFRDDD